MTKKQVDEYFISQIPQMEEVIKKILWKYKKNHLEPNLVINECYLHLMKHFTEDMTESTLKSIIVNFTNQNIYWKNSSMNKQERTNNLMDKITTDGIDNDVYDDNRDDKIDTSEEDINEKLIIEQWLNERQGVCELYYQQEQDKVKRIIYECYFKKNITKAVHLAKHLGISKYHSQKYYRDLKQDIFNYYKEYKKQYK